MRGKMFRSNWNWFKLEQERNRTKSTKQQEVRLRRENKTKLAEMILVRKGTDVVLILFPFRFEVGKCWKWKRRTLLARFVDDLFRRECVSIIGDIVGNLLPMNHLIRFQAKTCIRLDLLKPLHKFRRVDPIRNDFKDKTPNIMQ